MYRLLPAIHSKKRNRTGAPTSRVTRLCMAHASREESPPGARSADVWPVAPVRRSRLMNTRTHNNARTYLTPMSPVFRLVPASPQRSAGASVVRRPTPCTSHNPPSFSSSRFTSGAGLLSSPPSFSASRSLSSFFFFFVCVSKTHKVTSAEDENQVVIRMEFRMKVWTDRHTDRLMLTVSIGRDEGVLGRRSPLDVQFQKRRGGERIQHTHTKSLLIVVVTDGRFVGEGQFSRMV